MTEIWIEIGSVFQQGEAHTGELPTEGDEGGCRATPFANTREPEDPLHLSTAGRQNPAIHALVKFQCADEDVRGSELDEHPFLALTLFQPERAALRGVLPPIVAAFVAASTAYAAQKGAAADGQPTSRLVRKRVWSLSAKKV